MTIARPAVVQAAGAICWREVEGTVEVLLVHRAERADVSLPKGKVDPGETLPQTAVREIAEETGLSVRLGAPVGTTEYELPGGREKVVHYWVAEVTPETIASSTFSPNAEIASLEWLPVARARKALSYDRDRAVIDVFTERMRTRTLRTFPVIALRHGKAVPPASWDGPDSTRPLLHRGLEQARSVAPAIAAWAPAKLMSSPAVRCLSTIGPVSALTGLAVKQSKSISQDAYEEGTAHVRRVVRKRVEQRESVVLCSHGPVLPEIVEEVAGATGTPIDAPLRRAGMLGTSEFTVLHVSLDNPEGGLVAVETHGPAID